MQASARARAAHAAIALLASPALLASTARADEFPEAADSPSAFVTVIDARDYDDRFETVADLLDHTPGVRVRRYGPLGSYSTASIRGSKPEQVLVLLDGVRLNSAQRGAANLSALPLRTIGRIEVIRGAGAARYGSGAVGGVISIRTRTAPPGGGQVVDGSATSGRYETLGADLLVSRRGEGGGALVGYTRLQSENDFHYQVPALSGAVPRPTLGTRTHQRLNADFREDSALVRGDWEVSPELRLDGTLALLAKEGGQPGTTLGKNLRNVTDEQLSCLGPEEQYRRALVRLAGSRSRSSGSLSAALSYRLERVELRDPPRPGFELERSDCDLVPFTATGRRRSQATDQEATLDLAYAGPRAHIGPLDVHNRSALTLRFDHVRTLDAEPHRRAVGTLFTQQEMRLFEGRLRLVPSLGFEAARTSDGLARRAGFADFVETSIDDEPAWLPHIGVILRLAPGLRLKANWLRAYRRPSFTELFHPDWSFIRGNPALDAEDSINADVGLELRRERAGPLRDLELEAVAFRRDIRESIEWELLGQTFVPTNTGEALARGYEARGSLRLFGRLDLAASYTFIDTEFREGAERGFPLPQTPRNRLFASAALSLGPARIWAELEYEDERTLNEQALERLGQTRAVNAGIALPLRALPGFGWAPPGASLSSEWRNATSEARTDSLGLPLPASTFWYLRLRFRTE